MMKSRYLKSKIAVHFILFFGVMSGLLFSAGEGIRLFPFPFSQTARDESLKNNGRISYQLNAQFVNTHNQQNNSYKDTRQNNSPSLTNDLLFGKTLSFLPKLILKDHFGFTPFEALKSCKIKNKHGKRAPPFTI